MKTGADGQKILFVDVRDPIEIMFTGFTDTVDINIPYLLSNPHKWNDKKNVYAMEPNKDFESKIAKALSDRGVSKDDKIVLMCRSGGERGAPSAKALDGEHHFDGMVTTRFDGQSGSVNDRWSDKCQWI